MHTLLLSSPFFNAYSQSDLFGKMIFWGLFLLSAISWVLLVYKVWITKKVKVSCRQFEKFIDQRKDSLLYSNLEASNQFVFPYFQIYKVLKDTTLEVLNKNKYFLKSDDDSNKQIYLSQADIALVESHMHTEIADHTKFLEKNLFILSTVATLAPFLGLLGTVWGILITFSNLHTNAMSTSNSMVLTGLSMALATTVLGLVVAIPALVSYNYLKNSVKDFSKDLENFSHRLITTIEIQYRKVDSE